MLFAPPWLLEPMRLQGAYVSDDEIAATVARYPAPEPAPEPAPPRIWPRVPLWATLGLLALAVVARMLLVE